MTPRQQVQESGTAHSAGYYRIVLELVLVDLERDAVEIALARVRKALDG
jgi:hypothetical protein